MSLREEQCKKVCRILDDVLANRPTERDSLIVAVRKAFEALAEPKRGKWIDHRDEGYVECPFCRSATNCDGNIGDLHYCFSCGAKMEVTDG